MSVGGCDVRTGTEEGGGGGGGGGGGDEMGAEVICSISR